MAAVMPSTPLTPAPENSEYDPTLTLTETADHTLSMSALSSEPMDNTMTLSPIQGPHQSTVSLASSAIFNSPVILPENTLRFSDLESADQTWWTFWQERKNDFWWRYALALWWKTQRRHERWQWWSAWWNRRRRRVEKLFRTGKTMTQIMTPLALTASLRSGFTASINPSLRPGTLIGSLFSAKPDDADKENNITQTPVQVSHNRNYQTPISFGRKTMPGLIADVGPTPRIQPHTTQLDRGIRGLHDDSTILEDELGIIDFLQKSVLHDEQKVNDDTAALYRFDEVLDSALFEHLNETQKVVDRMEDEFRGITEDWDGAVSECNAKDEMIASLRIETEEKQKQTLELQNKLDDALNALAEGENRVKQMALERDLMKEQVETELSEKYNEEERKKHRLEVAELLGLTLDDESIADANLDNSSILLHSTLRFKEARDAAEVQLETTEKELNEMREKANVAGELAQNLKQELEEMQQKYLNLCQENELRSASSSDSSLREENANNSALGMQLRERENLATKTLETERAHREIMEELRDIKAELAATVEQLNALSEEHAKCDGKVSALKNELSVRESTISDLKDNLSEMRTSVDKEKEELYSQLQEAIRVSEAKEQEVETSWEERTALQIEVDALKNELENLKSSMEKQINEKIQAAREKAKRLQEGLDVALLSEEAIQGQLQELKVNYERHIEQLKTANRDIIGQKDEKIVKLSEELEQAMTVTDTTVSRLDSTAHEHAEQSRQLREQLEAACTKLDEKTSDFNKVQQEYLEIKESFHLKEKELEQKLQSCNERISSLQNEAENKTSALTNQLAEALGAVGVQEIEYEDIKKKEKNLQSEVQSLQEKLKSSEEKETQALNQLEQIKDAQDRLNNTAGSQIVEAQGQISQWKAMAESRAYQCSQIEDKLSELQIQHEGCVKETEELKANLSEAELAKSESQEAAEALSKALANSQEEANSLSKIVKNQDSEKSSVGEMYVKLQGEVTELRDDLDAEKVETSRIGLIVKEKEAELEKLVIALKDQEATVASLSLQLKQSEEKTCSANESLKEVRLEHDVLQNHLSTLDQELVAKQLLLDGETELRSALIEEKEAAIAKLFKENRSLENEIDNAVEEQNALKEEFDMYRVEQTTEMDTFAAECQRKEEKLLSKIASLSNTIEENEEENEGLLKQIENLQVEMREGLLENEDVWRTREEELLSKIASLSNTIEERKEENEGLLKQIENLRAEMREGLLENEDVWRTREEELLSKIASLSNTIEERKEENEGLLKQIENLQVEMREGLLENEDVWRTREEELLSKIASLSNTIEESKEENEGLLKQIENLQVEMREGLLENEDVWRTREEELLSKIASLSNTIEELEMRIKSDVLRPKEKSVDANIQTVDLRSEYIAESNRLSLEIDAVAAEIEGQYQSIDLEMDMHNLLKNTLVENENNLRKSLGIVNALEQYMGSELAVLDTVLDPSAPLIVPQDNDTFTTPVKSGGIANELASPVHEELDFDMENLDEAAVLNEDIDPLEELPDTCHFLMDPEILGGWMREGLSRAGSRSGSVSGHSAASVASAPAVCTPARKPKKITKSGSPESDESMPVPRKRFSFLGRSSSQVGFKKPPRVPRTKPKNIEDESKLKSSTSEAKLFNVNQEPTNLSERLRAVFRIITAAPINGVGVIVPSEQVEDIPEMLPKSLPSHLIAEAQRDRSMSGLGLTGNEWRVKNERDYVSDQYKGWRSNESPSSQEEKSLFKELTKRNEPENVASPDRVLEWMDSEFEKKHGSESSARSSKLSCEGVNGVPHLK